jgi:hypothetical protein
VHSLTIVIAASSLMVAVAVICVVRALQRRGEVGVRCSLELTPQDGWRLLNLAVVNRHDTKVWVERAAFVITDLDANMQSGAPNERGSVEIREFVRSGEDLCVSLIEAVYNAAGKPQGVYSFLFRCTVSYRLDERWLESESPVFRVEMVRLSSMRVRRVPAGGRAARAAASTVGTQSLLVTNEAPRREESRGTKPQSLDASFRS